MRHNPNARPGMGGRKPLLERLADEVEALEQKKQRMLPLLEAARGWEGSY